MRGRPIGVLGLLADLKFAFRQMRRRPAATIAALSILSVGLAATTAVFTVVQTVLLAPLPYPGAHRLVTIWGTFPEWRQQPALSAQWDRIALSYQEYSRVAASTRSLDGVAAAWFRTARVQDVDGTVTEAPIARGSASLLGILGVTPARGRWFLPGEEGPGAPHLAVLPNAMWRTKYGSDEAIVGRTIVIENEPFEVVGVLPANVYFGSISPFARANDDQAIWLPIGSGSSDLVENSQNYEVIARLGAGVTIERAADEILPLVLDGRDPAHRGARVVPRLEAETSAARTPLLTLFLAAMLLLAITCATLAALLLGEASRRGAEMRTRLALGAKPGRLVRQLLTESLLLASAGAVLAVPISIGLVRVLIALSPNRLPREEAIAIGWPTLAFAALAAMATGALFGLAPAWSFGRSGAVGLALGDRTGTVERTRAQRSMIAVEAALSMVLLVAAGLLQRSLANERDVPPGYRTDHLLAVSVAAPASADRRIRPAVPFFLDVGRALRALPGVDWVSATTNVPLGGSDGQWVVCPDPAAKLSISSPNAQHDAVEPGYFAAMGMRIVEGRALDDTDTPDSARAAVVNETMARTLWPGRSPVGLQFLAPNGGVRTVVGVAADIHDRGLALPARATFYESIRQLGVSRVTFVIHTTGSPGVLAAPARTAVLGVNRGALVERAISLDDLVADSMRTQRYRVLLLQFFGLAALAVTAVGGGVTLHAAVLRRRELCVRIAMGATPQSVRGLVLRQSARGLVVGVMAGSAMAAGIMRSASSYFFGLTWYDPATYVAAAVVLVGVASVAGWMAVGRVTPSDPSRELAGS